MQHIHHLSKDKKLKKIIALQQPVTLTKRKYVYLHLCLSIMSQQLSTQVAQVFHQRFLKLYAGKKPSLQQIADTPFEVLRGIGLSNAKANYVLNVARFFISEKITDTQLYKLENETLIQYLTQIKGVGRWTVEMILMFTLGREDIFALDDLGIQQAICKLYLLDPADKKKMKENMALISKAWSPYRTYACVYLWGWKDNTPSA
ncbi:MAG: DNA-3-methyladenine glycosylase 2 family protein [Chitinophagaceae bacterium]